MTAEVLENFKVVLMFIFNSRKKYHNAKDDTIAELVQIRTDLYEKRRRANMKILTDELQCLESKVRFIEAVLLDRIDIFRKNRAQITEQLQDHHFPPFNGTFEMYLDLTISDFTTENVDDLNQKITKNKSATARLRNTTSEIMWGSDLYRLPV
jgi:hypothetical protein